MNKNFSPWRERLHEVIFDADTPTGKLFDVTLLVLIVCSIVLVMLESIESVNNEYGYIFAILEWVITICFTIEYILRLICVYRPVKYALSFYGIIDLISTLPNYLALFLGASSYFSTVRALRLLRVFRILKLAKFLKESNQMMQALRASQAKITVFLTFVLIVVVVLGSVMYYIEGGQNSGFTSIPRSIYWAIVTLTTVGYGDISPVTPIGQFVAAIVMILGYGVIAVPTGIVSAEMVQTTVGDSALGTEKPEELLASQHTCRNCMAEGHDADALFCKFCGTEL